MTYQQRPNDIVCIDVRRKILQQNFACIDIDRFLDHRLNDLSTSYYSHTLEKKQKIRRLVDNGRFPCVCTFALRASFILTKRVFMESMQRIVFTVSTQS